ncbi:MAG: SAM-dependent methyltransferase [Pseudohongiellaceae bacterium]
MSRLFADPTRLRLLALLSREELSVAELTAATGLTQSRVSTHLGKLREAGLLVLRKVGTSTIYALDIDGMSASAREFWALLGGSVQDALLDEDRGRLLAHRSRSGRTWADSVAGRMERRYSPGRTWESATRAVLGLVNLGDVLDVASGDGALAELLAPRARSMTCLDWSPTVTAAGRRRSPSLRFHRGDMQALPFRDDSFDQVLLVNSLSYARQPELVVSEAARVLRPGGRIIASTLRAHGHESVAQDYNHVQLGFEPEQLGRFFTDAGLVVELCNVTSTERRAPYFQVLNVYAYQPNDARELSP